MKMGIISLLLSLVVFMVLPFFMFGEDGGPLLKGGVKVPEFSNPMDALEKANPLNSSSEKVQVYKWQDANGVWQFSSQPPAGQASVETIELSPNTNVMAPTPVAAESDPAPTGPRVSVLGGASPYSPDGVKQLVDQAKNVQEMLDERQKMQEQLLSGEGM